MKRILLLVMVAVLLMPMLAIPTRAETDEMMLLAAEQDIDWLPEGIFKPEDIVFNNRVTDRISTPSFALNALNNPSSYRFDNASNPRGNDWTITGYRLITKRTFGTKSYPNLAVQIRMYNDPDNNPATANDEEVYFQEMSYTQDGVNIIEVDVSNVDRITIAGKGIDGNNHIGLYELQMYGYNPTTGENWDIVNTVEPIIEWVDVTETTATLKIKQNVPNVFFYDVRINSLGLDADLRKVILPSPDPGADLLWKLTGLKPDTAFNAYVIGEYGTGEPTGQAFASMRTLSEASHQQLLKIYPTEKYLSQAAMTGFREIPQLQVKLKGYVKTNIEVNGNDIGEWFDGDVIGTSFFANYIKPNEQGRITMTSEGETVTYLINYIDPTQLPNYGNNGGTNEDGTPLTPTRPESGWDLIGWMKYLVDWLLYIVDSVIWVLAKLGGMIATIFTESTGFITTLATFFSFLPAELIAVMSMGLMIAILLRVFKR